MSKPTKAELVRKMADLLRAGAAMLNEHCPLCGTPLFRLKSGEVICPIHGRVVIVRTETERRLYETTAILERLEAKITDELMKALELNDLISVHDKLTSLLELLERVEKLLILLKHRTVSSMQERSTSSSKHS